MNNAGDGRYFASKEEAIAHVERLKAEGRRNIDVGCMQINLMHHPEAFGSLEEAFEPIRNVAYGARFLGALERETESWTRAVERYHTADPDRGRAYRERVYRRWAEAPAGDLPDGDGTAAPEVMLASLAAPDAAAAPVAEQRRAAQAALGPRLRQPERPKRARGGIAALGRPPAQADRAAAQALGRGPGPADLRAPDRGHGLPPEPVGAPPPHCQATGAGL